MAQESTLGQLTGDEQGAALAGIWNGWAAALLSSNSGPIAPPAATWYPFSPWWDTSAATSLLKIRNRANSAWVTIASWDGSTFIPYRGGVPIDVMATRQSNLAAGAAPLVGDDSDDGYGTGSLWAYAGALYGCAGASVGSASWLRWATSVLHMTDTPSSFSGQGSQFLAVNSGETAIEFVPSPNSVYYGTQHVLTSGATKDWTGIPTTLRAIDIAIAGASVTTADNIAMYLGDAGGFETTGYDSRIESWGGGTTRNETSHIPLVQNQTSGMTVDMEIKMRLVAARTWLVRGTTWKSTNELDHFRSVKVTSQDLDKVQLFIDNGGSAFDAGYASLIAW